jgi:hypothetical protein
VIPRRPPGAPLAKEVRKLVVPVLGDWTKTLQLALLRIVMFGCLIAFMLVFVTHVDPAEFLQLARGAAQHLGSG